MNIPKGWRLRNEPFSESPETHRFIGFVVPNEECWIHESVLDLLKNHAAPPAPQERSKCAALQGMDPPQDCNWPHCGCDSHADKVLTSLVEQGWGPTDDLIMLLNRLVHATRDVSDPKVVSMRGQVDDYLKAHGMKPSPLRSDVPAPQEAALNAISLAESFPVKGGDMIQPKETGWHTPTQEVGGETPYWLLFALAEYVEGHECQRGGETCSTSGDCITEYCAPCAAAVWLQDKRAASDEVISNE